MMWLPSRHHLFAILICSRLISSASLVVHERRDTPLRNAAYRERIEKHILLPMRIGLKSTPDALANAEKWLMDVSHPDSPNYGRHWSQEEVVKAFHPSAETISNVTAWLHDHGITEFTHSDNKLWFAFDVSVGHAESLLETEYFHHFTDEGRLVGSCDYYHLPAHLQAHIDYITPGVKESDITDRTVRKNKRSAAHSQPRRKRATSSSSLPALTTGPPYTRPTNLVHCSKEVTPECIQALYNFTAADPNMPVSPTNAMGIFESTGDIYLFYEYIDPDIPKGTSPIYTPIDGNERPFTLKNASLGGYVGPGLESNADVQVAIPIIYPQNVSVFEVLHDFEVGDNFFNRFFDAIDGSYCTPAQRGNSTNGGKPECGILKPTNVMSISYGLEEFNYPLYWQQRQCNEYLKLGLQGVSFFVASGDEGVGSVAYWEADTGNVCAHANATGGARVFSPTWPSSCPWITSVGGTQIPTDGTVEEPEIAVQFWLFYEGRFRLFGSSGGGFALNFKAPEYQAETLANYFQDYHPPWPAFHGSHYQNNTGRYNRDGRGYPDLSANALNTAVISRLGYFSFAGTSASAPTVAALFNRIIEERIRAGKGPLGFVNPTLYRNPEAFNDIVQGGNGYCELDQGFTAVPGWDPVTGLGTPNYPKLLDVFMKLP